MNNRAFVAKAARVLLASRASQVPMISNVRNSSYYKPAASWKPPHLDEMPVPQGSWKAQHDAEQKKYNIQLAIGLSFFLFTVTFVNRSGLIFFNAFPPELPEK